MASLGEILVKLGIDDKEFKAKLSDMKKQMSSSMSGVSDSMKGIGGKMSSIGASITTGLTLPLVAVGAGAFKMSKDFNKAMADVATLIPNNRKRVDELKTSVQEMAIATGKSTNDVARGLYMAISAFGDTADTAKILEINVRGATAGMASTEDAIKLTSAVTKAYGDTTAGAVSKVSDLAFMTVKLGQTTFPELAQAIGRVTPLSNELKVSQEELFAVFATLTGVTGGAAEVSTQFASVLRDMMKPTEDMEKAVKKLGFEDAQAMVKSLGLKDSLEKLIGTTDGSANSVSKLFASSESLTLALTLTGSQSDTFNDKMGQMKNSTGATNQAFKDATEGVNKAGFSFDQLKAKAEVTAQKLGDNLAPALSKIMDSIDPLIGKIVSLVEAFARLPASTQNAIVGFGLLAVVLGPIVSVFGTIITICSGVASAFGWISTALAPLAPLFGMVKFAFVAMASALGISVGWLIAIIAGIIVVIALVIYNWDTLKTATLAFWEIIKVAVSFAVAWVVAKIMGFVTSIKEKWAQIKTATSMVWEGIKIFLTTLWTSIVDKAKSAWESIKSSVSTVFNAIKTTVMSVWNGIYSGIKGVINKIIGAINGMISGLNRVKFDVPSWVPGIGGKKWGFNIGKIPYLAKGGIVTRPTLAMIGEAGPEAVVPLKKMQQSGKRGMVINITGNNINSNIDIDIIAQRLVSKLKSAGVY